MAILDASLVTMVFSLESNVIIVSVFGSECFSSENAEFAAGFGWNETSFVNSVSGLAFHKQREMILLQ